MELMPTNSRRNEISLPVLTQRWAAAEDELRINFPKVPKELWGELKGLLLYGENYQVTQENDPIVHAYLLSQLFSFSVLNVINRHVGIVPVHARLGCVGDGEGIAVHFDSYSVSDYAALEQDFLDHLKNEKLKAHALSLLN